MVSNQKIYLCLVKTGLLIFFIAIAFGIQNAFAQKYVIQSNADSSVVITKDSRLDDLVKKQKELNLQKQTIPGYRVQIYFGTMRQKAIELKSEFNSLHPQ